METPRCIQKTRAGGCSIQGRKPSQQDDFYVSDMTLNGQLVFVADGVGGHAHGEYASRRCVEIFREAFEDPDFQIIYESQFLYEYAMIVAEDVYRKGQEDPEYRSCGTTLSGFLIHGDSFHVVNIGDSRVYELNPYDQFIQLTKDHSLVQRLVDQGSLTPEEARAHPQRNVMYSAIGQPPEEIEIEVSGPMQFHKGAMLLAFSDGVHDALTDEEIRDLILKNRENADLCSILIQAAFDAGGTDNITACCYRL